MVNQVVMVGRLVSEPEIKETENGIKFTNLTIAVPRSYKNAQGEYETDFIDCVLWKDVAENTCEYCKKGDLLGVRGRVQMRTIESKEGDSIRKMDIVAERITFLSKAKEKEHVVNER